MPTVKLCIRSHTDWEDNPRTSVSTWGTHWTDSTNGDQEVADLIDAGVTYDDCPRFDVYFRDKQVGTIEAYYSTWERRTRGARYVNARGTSKKRQWRQSPSGWRADTRKELVARMVDENLNPAAYS